MTQQSFAFTENPDPASSARLNEILAAPGFGEYTTDYVAKVDWSGDGAGSGEWKNARIEPYGPLVLDPAVSVFHYGQEVFEGLKAYRHMDGSVWLFRPEANAQRLRRSARRLALPELPDELFLEAVTSLVRQDSRWIPDGEGTSLYLRPFIIATEKFLGVRPSREALFEVVASPAANYFGTPEPVDIWWSRKYARAGVGGTGAAKCGGNYAASLVPQMEGEAHGCKQVMFTDENRDHAVEELGGMNVFFVLRDGTLVTPALTGTILEGITRMSIIELAQERGHTVEERTITVDEWRRGVESGEISEVFACGTAAVIAPMGRLVYEDGEIPAAAQTNGEVTTWLRSQLTGIQTGRVEDRFGWMQQVI
ncbi:branched-chain amino acid aminotransferase [uncultured Kocuria sp.]|uniref:branched-chain amino acid aminotransferase n=1 Tax=uncultured Kocuria sp. TaxID=259305 RepID=UPI00259A9906|nr:branched-chain amino acid aminotransferase [uncultured Kocuria sp.]MCT1368313.1 branched-chain amino acid aminotransferase [Rothia sp. p3-SID1597]